MGLRFAAPLLAIGAALALAMPSAAQDDVWRSQEDAYPPPVRPPAVLPPPAEPEGAPLPSDPDADPPPPLRQRGADGRIVDDARDLAPVDPSQGIAPADLERFPGAATRVTTPQIETRRPRDNHELLSRVPGVTTVDDDGAARHVNIGVRGAPVRRARKILLMEDGQAINLSTYLDPSAHYTPPTERIESVEVVRGTVFAHGPLNNHGVINFRNLDPFGTPETVLIGSLGHTDGVHRDLDNTRHLHTRQSLGPFGMVASYSGGESGGSWDNEALRYNDFHGALAWRGARQDLTVSGGYFRQRDDYDEINFVGFESDFFANGRSKSDSSLFQGSHQRDRQLDHNSYNADFYRVQLAHNLYVDEDTTLSTRAFYSHHERNRFESRRGGPSAGGHMRGREREYEIYGVDSRLEIARRPLFAGMSYDFQVGARAEWHDFENCNSGGRNGEKLGPGNSGSCFATFATGYGTQPGDDDGRLVRFEADAISAFTQVAIRVTRDFTITPGLRFETYDLTRDAVFNPELPLTTPGKASSDHHHVLPGVGFAWEALPRTTLYGGFHQGITPQVARGPSFPLPDEKGNNVQVGVRSQRLRGLTFDLAYFHSDIDDYQVKSPVTDGFGNAVYGAVDEVRIDGFEAYTRLDSRPLRDGPWNLFGEAVYTFAHSEIVASPVQEEVGNQVPEVPRHFANLTVGLEHASGFDVSVTGTYRGEFFTDALNTRSYSCITDDGEPIPCGDGDAEAVVGGIDGQWLLSARVNYAIPRTNATLFVAGQNLTNEFYVADAADGVKPGVGRTVAVGLTVRFD